ncbi:cadherin-like domain-containing protein [Magnetospira sp. QH-2]|uniref:cadherin-like domain-containing protein n=1 Tax=Magnetospira sp. (strain QH-2) TaxID=1288970 RepID=UPI0003E81984|nr:cadherin-like domain-containing protein [Magnetospira sp. QH-2]CCQ75339.1 protein of unknown function [Magnetospira sp. QH-2]
MAEQMNDDLNPEQDDDAPRNGPEGDDQDLAFMDEDSGPGLDDVEEQDLVRGPGDESGEDLVAMGNVQSTQRQTQEAIEQGGAQSGAAEAIEATDASIGSSSVHGNLLSKLADEGRDTSGLFVREVSFRGNRVSFGDSEQVQTDDQGREFVQVQTDSGQLVVFQDGGYEFAPVDDGIVDPVNDEFVVIVENEEGDTATVTLALTGTDEDLIEAITVNSGPTTTDQSFTMNEDGTLTITETQLLAGSADADGDTLTVSSIDGVSNGTLVDNGDSSWTFTPDADWNGDLSFSYTVVDGEGGSSTADLDISVASVNDGPTTPKGSFTMNEDGTLTL